MARTITPRGFPPPLGLYAHGMGAAGGEPLAVAPGGADDRGGLQAGRAEAVRNVGPLRVPRGGGRVGAMAGERPRGAPRLPRGAPTAGGCGAPPRAPPSL